MNRLIMFATVFLATGCAVTQPIKYSVEDIRSEKISLSQTKVRIEPVIDSRNNASSPSIAVTSSENKTTYQGKMICVNSENHYDSGKVSAQITDMLIAHIRKKYPDVVLVSNNEQADVIVSSDIETLSAFQEASGAALIGAQFGLIGALMTANVTSKGEIEINFGRTVFKNRVGHVLSEIEPVQKKWSGEFSVDAYCFSPYRNVNEKLKMAIDELVEKMVSELKKIRKNT